MLLKKATDTWELSGDLKPTLDSTSTTAITAMALTADNHLNYVGHIISGLKWHGYFARFYALWGMVGGTLAAQLVNMINPGTHDLTYSGTGWTFDDLGSKPDGATNTCNTNLTPSTTMTLNSTCFGFIGGQNITNEVNRVPMGVAVSGGNPIDQMRIALGGTSVMDSNSFAVNRITVTPPHTMGLFCNDRAGANDHRAFHLGAQISATDVVANGAGLPTAPQSLSILNIGGAGAYTPLGSSRSALRLQLAFASDSFSVAEHVILNDILSGAQEILWRRMA